MTISNMQPAIDDLNSKLRELGRESVKSGLAKPSMAIAVIAAAKQGIITNADAKHVYAEYLSGREHAIGRNDMAVGMEDNAKSRAANESKVKANINAAIIAPDFPATVRRLVEARATAKRNGGEVKDIYQAIYDASVIQNTTLKSTRDLTDEELDTIVRKKAREEKGELDRMVDEYKRLYSLAHGNDDRDGIAECLPVLDAMGEAIESFGGKIPAMTKEEKKAEKAIKFLQSTGHLAAA